MILYRNEEIVVGNHIAVPFNVNFIGGTLGIYKIDRITREGAYISFECEGNDFSVKGFHDFKSLKGICGE
jgi:hypothetical protein